MNRNLEEHKRKTTNHASGDRVNVRQKGSTKRINNGIGLINQLKSICQAPIRAILDPRIPEKIIFRGAFNGGLKQENFIKIRLFIVQ